MNCEDFQLRLDLIKSILTRLEVEATEITPVAYDPDCPFPYNNFIYKVHLSRPLTEECFQAVDFYSTRPRGEGVFDLIIRLSNPEAEGLNHANRVENEVDSMYLARKGIESFKPEVAHVIPLVYSWESPKESNHGLGWILMDFKPGLGLDEHFASASNEEKVAIIEQVADIFAGIQRAPIPATVSSYGGLTINGAGEIVSGQMTVLTGRPWGSYADFWKTKFVSQLKYAEESPALRGRKENGVRERIDKLLAADLESVLLEAGVETIERTLVHGDLTLNNMLYDVTTKKITGLVDFDVVLCKTSILDLDVLTLRLLIRVLRLKVVTLNAYHSILLNAPLCCKA